MLFLENDYRKAIRSLLRKKKKLGDDVTLQDLAVAVRVQRPYLSKVLNGMADLSSEQMFSLSRYFKLSDEETRYLGLLLERERSSTQERKAYLEHEIAQIRSKNLSIQKHIKAPQVKSKPDPFSKYYLDPTVQLVHLFLTVPRYRADTTLIADSLKISKARLNGILKILNEMKIIEIRDDEFHVIIDSLHLPKESVLFLPQQALVRLKSANHILETEVLGSDESNYNLSVCFSADRRTRRLIQECFLDFLRKTEKLVKNAPAEEVLQMNFDLFPWSIR